MKIVNKLKNAFRVSTYASKASKAINPMDVDPVNDFGGTRNTLPKFTQGSGGLFGALPKKSQSDLRVSDASLMTMSIEDLLDVLVDMHPDVSYAVWNFNRIGSSGYTIQVKNIEDDEINEEGTLAIDMLIKRLSFPNMEQFEVSRSFDKVVAQLFQSVVVRGACSLELVLTPGLDDIAFIAPVDPATVDFKFENDRYVPYQDEETLSLDIPTFFYEGLDEMIDNPYGRSPIISALNIVFFNMQVLNDLKQVVHNQGYPRLDISILEHILLERMPITIRNNEEKKQKWLNEKLAEIIEMYNSLDPTDSFVHYDSVKVDMVGGNSKGGAMIDPEKLMHVLDGQITAGLKTLSTILGRRSTGNTESFAKMEIKLYIKGVEAIQNVVESILSRALTLALNIMGIQGIVQFKYNPIEIRTSMEQAQFEQIHLLNCQFKRDQGWISQDEASMLAVGHTAESATPINNTTPKNSDGGDIQGARDEKTTEDDGSSDGDEE